LKQKKEANENKTMGGGRIGTRSLRQEEEKPSPRKKKKTKKLSMRLTDKQGGGKKAVPDREAIGFMGGVFQSGTKETSM